MEATNKLKKELNKRHILFIALGSAIGTGLFLGSATTIRLAGPSVLFAYIIAGLAAFLTMRALGEMVINVPHLKTFGSYAGKFISPLAGFITGWSYVFQMALVCLADITAFATYMQFWYPDVSAWIWTLALACFICAVNLATVKIYGELEFWFSVIKVLAILVMIAGGIFLISTGFHSAHHSVTHVNHVNSLSYWFPNGISGFVQCLPIVIYSFGGIEIIGITAAEAKHPETSIPKAINTIPFRIIFFYVLTIGVLISIYPWDQIGIDGSPFVTICEALGIHSAANILNIIVITAAVSAINSDIYGSSRMIYSLAEEGHALKHLNKLNKKGVPVYAIFVMLSVLISGVVFNYFDHEGLFVLMANLAALTSIVGWFMIVLAQLFMRFKMTAQEKANVKYPVPLWPIASVLTLLFFSFIMGLIAIYEVNAFCYGLFWLVGLIAIYLSIKHLDKTGRFVQKVAKT
ncbi:amino acid permease [Bartonella sp. TP]|uniref:amino acid permease n=1 Tax=Bartonella sp. TP TaxID=3057550 RepID=UPI0025AF1560|nr:amino acid permease [Bartonella sp. TP]WJW79746.1 amino acid permease [Bartonella sp. TP]